MSHPDNPNRFAIIPFRRKDLSKGTLKSILRQAGLTKEELIELIR
jgi:predicted RNA binding protein YcfA (HicA-like mRNA interferase family)